MNVWHVVANMAKARKSAPAAEPDSDPLVLAVDRLTTELAVLRQVMDEIREDFSWVTRNGFPLRPIEHVHVKRMALDPSAEDWGERLEIERSTCHSSGSASLLDSDTLDHVVEELKSTFEAAAQGQLEVVLNALDGVRVKILGALRYRREESTCAPSESTPSGSSLLASSSSISSPTSESLPSSDEAPAPKPPSGQLF